MTLLLSTMPSQKALGWGAVKGVAEVHQLILRTAHNFLRLDSASNLGLFPGETSIQQNEGVTDKVKRTGPGPDADNSNSHYSEHWYNYESPGIMGNAPDKVSKEFLIMARSGVDRQAGRAISLAEDHARAAAWGAHFLADMETPFHVNGTSAAAIRQIYDKAGGSAAERIDLDKNITGPLSFNYGWIELHYSDFKTEIERFLAENKKNANLDWFDPWYFNGAYVSGSTISSSHVLWEAKPGNISSISAVTVYDPDWNNATPTFDDPLGKQSKQAEEYTKKAAINTRKTQEAGLKNPQPCVQRAAQRVATLWRASFSALIPKVEASVPDSEQPQKFKVKGTVKNLGGGKCTEVQAMLRVDGGTILDRDKTKEMSDIEAGRSSKEPVYWDVEASSLYGCTITMEVICSYSQPDLQYALTEYETGKIKQAEKTTTPPPPATPKTHSTVILFNASSQMGKISHDEAVPMVLKAMENLPDSVVEVALYSYGEHPQQGDCSVWGNPFVPPSQMADKVRGYLSVKTETRGSAPLAKAITEAGNYLKTRAKGETKSIVLISCTARDTCGGDPIKAAKELGVTIKRQSWSPFVKYALAADDSPITLQVVGVYVNSPPDEQGLKDLAAAGNGQYFSVANINQMSAAITGAIQAGEKSSASRFEGITIQPWWFALGGAALLLFILLLARSRRRRAQPAVQTAGINAQQQPVTTTTPQMATSIPPAVPVTPTERKVLFCPKCGSQTYQEASFCVRCGSTLELSAPLASMTGSTAAQSSVFCPRCGAANAPGSAFCNKCEVAIQPDARLSKNQASRKEEKKVSWAWWLLPIFLALLGGLIAWAAVRKEDPKLAGRILMLGVTITALLFWAIVSNLPD